MERFAFDASPSPAATVVVEDGIRISLLTPRLLRSESGSFTDEATQTVWNRTFPAVEHTLSRENGELRIKTEAAQFAIDCSTGDIKSVVLANGQRVADFDEGNLLGTARTLDGVNGATKLQKGLMSRSGASIMDNSASLIVRQDGSIVARPTCSDKYCFAYGSDYRACLRDFFRLTGETPLIPKFALGNWWSRYKVYTQEEYEGVIKGFLERRIPLSVATIDMEWHWTDVIKRFGKKARPCFGGDKADIVYYLFMPGWTGYSWNTELFPDHCAMLEWLHKKNLRVTMNVHPASGARFYEDKYDDMCRVLGKDPKKGEQLAFNAADPEYIKAYLDCLHHPLEREGVDFWWIDWQQGTKSATAGLDPLWALNHYHTLDSARGEKRGLTLSRYAGLGSHRYPLGFSGDTFSTWKSLEFQPYFTITAANAGYTWWSHDIGGHQFGTQDDELYLRWLQFGVFSPINRLHSTSNEFMGKEPWKRSWAAETAATRFLRLRQRLIPYLYTANYNTHKNGVPLCEPMYYSHDCEQAYAAKNQYMFGSELLVCPITQPADKLINLAACEVWLPEGRWTDVFNGRIYSGGRKITMHRDLDSIPVLAHEGSIIPLYSSGESNDISLEQPLDINVWRGNGEYALYDDDGETNAYTQGHFAITRMTVREEGDCIRFTVFVPQGDASVLPKERRARIIFRDLEGGELSVNGDACACDEDGAVAVEVVLRCEKLEVVVEKAVAKKNKPRRQALIDLLTRAQAGNYMKMHRYTPVIDDPAKAKHLSECVRSAVREICELSY